MQVENIIKEGVEEMNTGERNKDEENGKNKREEEKSSRSLTKKDWQR